MAKKVKTPKAKKTGWNNGSKFNLAEIDEETAMGKGDTLYQAWKDFHGARNLKAIKEIIKNG